MPDTGQILHNLENDDDKKLFVHCCLNCVQSPFTAKGLSPFRNPMNIVLEQPRAKNVTF